MLRPRIIPCLLLKKNGLIKTIGFQGGKYIGDPINAVKIFNEKRADELIVLDIEASVIGIEPDYKKIKILAAECRMPLCYGGGVKSAAQAKRIIGLGVEKVAISSAAIETPLLIKQTADEIGSQSVALVLDVKESESVGGYEVWTHNATRNTRKSPFELAMIAQTFGVGEIIINCINHDGRMSGYDYRIASEMRSHISVPMTVLGGAGSLEDIEKLIDVVGVVGAGAGSLFVFKGPYKAVLINYPTPEQKDKIFNNRKCRIIKK